MGGIACGGETSAGPAGCTHDTAHHATGEVGGINAIGEVNAAAQSKAQDVNGLAARSEEDLARDARAGSLASFDELARRVQGPLVAFLGRRFPSRRDAEDVAQEALVRAWRALPSYRDGMRVRTWLLTIAYRLAVSRGRREVATVAVPAAMGDWRDGPPETASACGRWRERC